MSERHPWQVLHSRYEIDFRGPNSCLRIFICTATLISLRLVNTVYFTYFQTSACDIKWLTFDRPHANPCFRHRLSHSLAARLRLSLTALPPCFQHATLHPSFLRRFHLPSLYFTDTSCSAVSGLSPSLHCPSPSKAITFLSFFLYLHDTKGFSEAGKGQRPAFYKTFYI